MKVIVLIFSFVLFVAAGRGFYNDYQLQNYDSSSFTWHPDVVVSFCKHLILFAIAISLYWDVRRGRWNKPQQSPLAE